MLQVQTHVLNMPSPHITVPVHVNHLWYWVLGLATATIILFAVGGAFMHKRSTKHAARGDHTVGLIMLICGCVSAAALMWRLWEAYSHHEGVKRATATVSDAQAKSRLMMRT